MVDTATATARAVKLPDGWRMVRFGEMANSITDRVDDPSQAGVDTYVGLEHLDSESLKIRRWGTPADVQATKLRFKIGDLIFGRRRAYQRKLAVAEFEGICSAHALVLRAREDVVEKDFLPFLMQSDIFFDRALAISVGSLSPTINWSTLARQEFALPSKHEQRRIAEILWAADAAGEQWKESNDRLRELCDSTIETIFSVPGERVTQSLIRYAWRCIPLRQCATIRTGLAKGKRYGNERTVRMPYLRVANVQDGYLKLDEIKTIDVSSRTLNRYELKYGDVLMNEGGDFDKLGRGTVWHEEISGCLHQNHVFAVRVQPSLLLPEFLSLQTASSYGKRYFLSCAKQTTNLASINSTQLAQFPVLLPSIHQQQLIVEQAERLSRAESEARAHLKSVECLRKALNQRILQPRSNE